MNSALLSFIRTHSDWKDVLSKPPYNLAIKEDPEYPNFYIFSYNQIESDFSNPVVKDSRGTILYINSPTIYIACNPFSKFFNYGESNAAKVDWNTTKILEKVDGSLIKLWYNLHDKKWMISTNGTIDAFKTDLPDGTGFFGDLAYKLMYEYKLDTSKLDHSSTYMFELVSLHNRVVVPYKNDDLYYLGSRNNKTGKEFHDKLCDIFPQPKKYTFLKFEDILSNLKELPFDQEGYVAVDAEYNRIKLKSAAYLIAHRLKNNSVISYARILDMLKIGEDSEFLSYFPEYQEGFDLVRAKWEGLKEEIKKLDLKIPELRNLSRKDFAMWVKENVKGAMVSFAFMLYDNDRERIANALEKITYDKL